MSDCDSAPGQGRPSGDIEVEVRAVAGSRIQATEQRIGEIFSDAYRFTIPGYQRPYAWTTEQAGEMLDDLLTAARCEHKLENSDPYFLGSVVLVKAEGDATAEVVDGQQRLTTLMTLLSVIRGFLPEAFAASVDRRIYQQGDPITGASDQPRLILRDKDHPFLEKQILDRQGVTRLDTVATVALTDSQRNLVANAKLFQEQLGTLSEEECRRLLTFIDQYTYAEASNREFAVKKAGYFTGRSGTSPFPLTSQVLGEPEWSPAVLERRQKDLLAHLQELWRLTA